MARQEIVLHAFASSPGDVAAERNALEEVVRELNQTWSRKLGVRVELLRWETDTMPAIGVDGQAVINDQIGDDYDIFIGILWARFGTPTPRADSGTEEEFNRAVARHVSKPGSVAIMMYFKDAPLTPSSIDPDQLRKVGAFKKAASGKGILYKSFGDTDEFKGLLRAHLSKHLQAWLDATKAVDPPPPTSPPSASTPAAIAAAGESVEPGYIDLLDNYFEAGEKFGAILARMGDDAVEFGKAISSRTEEMLALKRAGPPMDRESVRRAKGFINAAAGDMKTFAARLAAETPVFASEFGTFATLLGRLARLSVENSLDDETEFRSAHAQGRKLLDGISLARANVALIRDQVGDSMPLTGEFAAAQTALKTRLNELVSEFDRASSLLGANLDVLDMPKKHATT